MTIDTIKQTDLTVSERQVLDDDRERWRRMGSGAHLDDWLAYGPGLLIRRRLAMRIAYVNRPEGKGYARAFAQLMEHDGLDGGALAARRAGALVGPARDPGDDDGRATRAAQLAGRHDREGETR